MTETLLKTENIRKEFGNVVANRDVDFELQQGEIHSILGENGAGKSTFMKLLYGVYEPDGGTLAIHGENCDLESPAAAIEHGVGLVYQEFKLIPTFTVLENAVLGLREGGSFADDVADHRDRLAEMSQRYGLGLENRLDWRVSELAEGEKQRVELLKTLYRDVDILLLDEPTSILTPHEVEQLFDVLETLVETEQLGIVFITHKLEEALAVSDRITVLRDGAVAGSTSPLEADQRTLARMMVGKDDVTLVERRTRRERSDEPTRLTVEGLTVRNERGQLALNDVSFRVAEGEIFGVVGVEGNGQRELVEAVSGMRVPDAGQLTLEGSDITTCSRRELQARGLRLIPDAHGVIEEFTIPDNCILDEHHQYFDWFRDEAKIARRAEALVEQFNIKVPGQEATASQLSGGNKQKVVLGRKLTNEPRRLTVAFNPTKGLDIDTKSFIHDRLMDERDDDRSVLLVTTNLEEAIAVSDRLAVLNDGQFLEVYDDPTAPTREAIGLAMTRTEERK